MNTAKTIGYAGITGLVLALSANAPSFAESTAQQSAASAPTSHLVQRVDHTLAAAQHYTGSMTSGYKWSQPSAPAATAEPSKWGSAKLTTTQWADANVVEQTRNRWCR